MSWIRPKRTEPARPAPAPSPAPAAPATPAVGVPQDDEDLPIDLASGAIPVSSTPARASTPQAPASAGTTTLTDDTTIVGSITTASDLWIAGRVDGNIQSGAAVNVAVDGAIKGDVIAQRVRVEEGGTI